MRAQFLSLALSIGYMSFGASQISYATEFNTYRAGQPYQKITAINYKQCAAQCRGDAACRGWNFIKPNKAARSGICEFNARLANPIPSPVSVSGEIITDADAMLSKAVPSQSSHTIRVGTPIVAPKRKVRKIIRKPIPQAKSAKPTAYKAPRTQLSQNSRQAINKNINPQMAVRKNLVTRLSREQVYQRHLKAAQRRLIQNQANINQAKHAQAPRPSAIANYQQNQVQKPVAPQIKAPQIGSKQATPMQAGNAQQQAANFAPQSLYGSLNDDLTKNMTPVPRPQTAPDRPDDPDAPISTVKPAPVTPVKSEVLIPAGLAGG